MTTTTTTWPSSSTLFLPQLNERGWLFISYFAVATHSLLSVTLSTSSKVNHILFSPLISLANVLVHGNHVFRGTTSSLRFSSLKQRSSGNLRRDCVPAWRGEPCWYFRNEFFRKKRKKKRNSVHAFLITISSLHATPFLFHNQVLLIA